MSKQEWNRTKHIKVEPTAAETDKHSKHVGSFRGGLSWKRPKLRRQ